MILLLAITSSIISITLVYINKVKSRKGQVPPGPPQLPLIGNLHQFIGAANSIHVYLWQLSKKYGPFMHMKLASKPVLVISSAKLAEEVLKTQDSSFCSRPKLLGQQKLSYNGLDIGLAPYGNHWREFRKIITNHLLSVSKIQSFRPIREDEVSQMVRMISDSASFGEAVNLSEISMSLSSTLMCRVAFSKRYEQGSEQRRFSDLLHEAEATLVAFFVSDYFPSLGWIDKVSGLIDQLETTFKKMDTFYRELINEHLDPKREKRNGKEDDFLDILIQLKEQKSCSIDLNWDSIKALLMNICPGGIGTSATAVVGTMTALMKAPRVMKKLQVEIRELIGPKVQVEEGDLHKLSYLKAVISESFRLHPPGPLLIPRETIDKCIVEGYEVQPETLVYINAWAIARDPEYWENPLEFLPERFLDNNINIKGLDFGVIPFGSGRRICPAITMGFVNVELLVANLLYSFDWEFSPGVQAQDIDEESLPGIAMPKKNPLILVPCNVYV